jgi:hypothetical protein
MQQQQSQQVAGCGILVIECGYALCGLTPKSNKYSGIGGKQIPGETVRVTAFREAVEELFGIDPSDTLVYILVKRFIDNLLIERDNYYYIALSFTDVNALTAIVCMYNSASPYYKTFPSSIMDLVLNRCPTETAEITDLTMTRYTHASLSVDREFIKDCLKAEHALNEASKNRLLSRTASAATRDKAEADLGRLQVSESPATPSALPARYTAAPPGP